MLCPKCHTQNRDNAKFCKVCGLAFTPEVLAAAASQPVETAQTQQAQSMPSADSREHSASVSVASPQDAPATEEEQAPSGGNNTYPEDDIAQAPTQILTPQQMIAYHTKRWQQELDREQQLEQSSLAQKQQGDIADTPTMLFKPATEQEDVADMPTILVPPVNGNINEPVPVPPPPPPESLLPTAPSQVDAAPVENATLDDVDTTADTTDTPNTEANTTTNTTVAQPSSTDESVGQEDAMEQVTPTSGGQPEQDQAQAPSEIPTISGNRYQYARDSDQFPNSGRWRDCRRTLHDCSSYQ